MSSPLRFWSSLLLHPHPCLWRDCQDVETFPPSGLPPQGTDPYPGIFSLFLFFSFGLPHSKEIDLSFWKTGVFCLHSASVLQEFFHMQIYFLCICGKIVDLPVLLLHHLLQILYISLCMINPLSLLYYLLFSEIYSFKCFLVTSHTFNFQLKEVPLIFL